MVPSRYIKTACIVLGAVLVVALLRGCVATSYVIPSTGMENTLYQGERILVNKWSYGLRLPFMQWWGYHRWRPRPADKEDIVVFNNPGNLTVPVIDRREVFIGRCTGTPGDTLLVDSFFTVVSSASFAPDQKHLYTYPQTKKKLLDSLQTRLSIRSHDLPGADSTRCVRSFSRYEYYLLEQTMPDSCWLTPLEADSLSLKPFIVPRRGQTVPIYPWNQALLCNTLVLHEHRRAEIKNDTLYIDGKPARQCRFTKDYYWITANNAANLSDSRLFGLVPEDHLIGRAALIWFSAKRERIGKKIY